MTEKDKIKVNYSDSGVKTLYGFAIIFIIFAVFATIVTIIGFIMYLVNSDSYSGDADAATGLALASAFLPVAINLFALGAIAFGLSSVAKTALFKRTLLEQQYEFEEQQPEHH
jgi:Mn2+/Fe2+ NRAMP family transporter